ncbi:tRNA(Ile)-lysidine synthase [Micrococcus endophyticus]|uniref:tRNA(Ile)-lysidine synthase n=1 Tax=Micrococcus endophyticus TaxID=455343 RepID=A0A7W9JKT3_9MICC|nr:tRNA(Ile)-lysidine synthase [Micrococcus endophyticus]
MPSGSAAPPALESWPPRGRWPEPLHRAVAALRPVLAAHDGGALIGLSGGADSCALAVAAAALRGTRAGAALGPVGAVVVDHGLQAGSADVAEAAARVARTLGLEPVLVRRVAVREAGDGPEAAARRARRGAFADAAREAGAGVVLTAHTADDQAEQVLLGLARGSGTRSLAGIPAAGALPGGAALARPLLGLTRADAEAICRWAGVRWWEDPHNADPALLRSRVRTRVLPALEDPADGLGPGVREGLVRTAAIAAEDAAALEQWAARALAECRAPGRGDAVVRLDLAAFAALPPAVRHRVLGLAVVEAGGPRPTRERTLAVDALAVPADPGAGGSAGPVELPGGVEVRRRHSGGPGEGGDGGLAGPESALRGGRGCAMLEIVRRAARP